jgi:hypothetical protein
MEPEIKLLPLTDAEYAEFAERQVTEVARQHVNAGEWPTAEALTHAREECTDLLTDILRDDATSSTKVWISMMGRWVGCGLPRHQHTAISTVGATSPWRAGSLRLR